MCELVRYYESDTTIFLLLEYVRPGKLASNLSAFYETSSNVSIESTATPYAQSESADTLNRRTSTSSSFKHKYNNSVSGLPSFDAKLTNTSTKLLTTADSIDKTKLSTENGDQASTVLQVKPAVQLVEVNLATRNTDKPKKEKLSE